MPRRLTNQLLLAVVLGLVASGLLGWLLPEPAALPLYGLHRALGVGLLLGPPGQPQAPPGHRLPPGAVVGHAPCVPRPVVPRPGPSCGSGDCRARPDPFWGRIRSPPTAHVTRTDRAARPAGSGDARCQI